MPACRSQLTFQDAAPVVWPSVDGQHGGAAVEPLYASAAGTLRHNPELYELLTLVDALRIGRARERLRARGLLQDRLSAAVEERR